MSTPETGIPLEYKDDDSYEEGGGVATLDEKDDKPEDSNPYDFTDESTPQEGAPVEAEQSQDTVAKAGGEKAKDKAEQQEQPESDSGLNDLLGRAEEYGFSKEDAAALPPDVLRKAMATIDKQLSTVGRKAWESWQAHQLAQQQAAAEKNPKAEAQQPSESDLHLDEELVDPAIAKFSKAVAAELKALRDENAKLKHVPQQAQAEAAQNMESKMDSFFDGLGDEFGEVFGKGSIRKLDGQALRARQELWVEMNALHDGYLNVGRQPPAFEELQQRALNSLHPDKIKIQARKEVEKKLAERKKSSVAKPTSKIGKPMSRLESAVAFAEKFAKEHSLEAAADDDGEI